MMVSDLTSNKIKNMSFLCAILVVIIHVKWPHAEFGVNWLMENVVHLGICQIAVPFFFVVSGYFLAMHFDESAWWGCEVRKRIKTLMLPFFLWHILFFLLVTPQSVAADIVAHRPFGTSIYLFKPNLLHLFGLDIHEGLPALGPLWYVRALFILVCCAPVIKWCVDKLGVVWLAMAFTGLLTFSFFENSGALGSHAQSFWLKFFNFGFSLSGLLYLSVGFYIQRKKPGLGGKRLSWMLGVVGLLMILIKAGLKYFSVPMFFPLDKLMIPFMMYFIWTHVSSSKWPSWIADVSFPLYVVHSVMRPYTKYCQGFGGPFLELAALVLGSLMIIALMKLLFPKTFFFLFAGRGMKLMGPKVPVEAEVPNTSR